jgi:hypothetical protein
MHMSDTSGMRKTREKATAVAEGAGAQMAAATQGAADLMRNALQATQDYNAKVLEFAVANANATFEYLSKLSGTKAPSDFIELTTRHMREQSDVLSRQARELSEMAQKFLPKANDVKVG